MNKLIALLALLYLGTTMTVLQTNVTQAKKAIFAGGCFWCMESPFEKIYGVSDVISGYTGGTAKNPTYKNYADTGHIEAIEVTYDPSKVSYKQLLENFWQNIDPTDPGGQFGDRGPQYRSAIFYGSPEEKKLAEKSKLKLAEKKIFYKPIVTEILPVQPFYAAEEYHQDYYRKNPIRYNYFKFRSGRDTFFKQYWD